MQHSKENYVKKTRVFTETKETHSWPLGPNCYFLLLLLLLLDLYSVISCEDMNLSTVTVLNRSGRRKQFIFECLNLKLAKL